MNIDWTMIGTVVSIIVAVGSMLFLAVKYLVKKGMTAEKFTEMDKTLTTVAGELRELSKEFAASNQKFAVSNEKIVETLAIQERYCRT